MAKSKKDVAVVGPLPHSIKQMEILLDIIGFKTIRPFSEIHPEEPIENPHTVWGRKEYKHSYVEFSLDKSGNVKSYKLHKMFAIKERTEMLVKQQIEKWK